MESLKLTSGNLDQLNDLRGWEGLGMFRLTFLCNAPGKPGAPGGPGGGGGPKWI
jgi:hypothetical protein